MSALLLLTGGDVGEEEYPCCDYSTLTIETFTCPTNAMCMQPDWTDNGDGIFWFEDSAQRATASEGPVSNHRRKEGIPSGVLWSRPPDSQRVSDRGTSLGTYFSSACRQVSLATTPYITT